MDWAAWSRESVALMVSRTRALFARHAIEAGTAYAWTLETADFAIGGVTLRLVTVGTVTSDAFLWAWANDAISPAGKVGIERVRQFGVEHELGLLVEPCASGGLGQAKECLAIAGRVLDASGTWIDEIDGGHILFSLFD
jgi:hypothetical protein